VKLQLQDSFGASSTVLFPYWLCTLVIAACSSTKHRPRCPAAAAVVHRSLPPSSDLDSLGNGLTLTWPGRRWLLMKDTALVYSVTKSLSSSTACSRSPSLSLRTRISHHHHESVLCPPPHRTPMPNRPYRPTNWQPARASPPTLPRLCRLPPRCAREAARCLVRVIPDEQIR
jgi:hypothetical protein